MARTKGNEKLVAVGLYLPQEADSALKSFCQRNRQSKSGLVRDVILNYMREKKIWDDENPTQSL